METLLLRDLDDRVDGDGLTWWIHLDSSLADGKPFAPYVKGLPLDAAELRGWWRIGFDFDPEKDEVELVSPGVSFVASYRRRREVEGYPETLTPDEYNDRTDPDEEGYDEIVGVLYEAVYDKKPAYVVERVREWTVLDGAPPPKDGLSWQPKLPAALRTRQEYAHLFPGDLLGYREAVAEALNALEGVQAYARTGSPHVQVFLHVKLPRLERIEWQRTPFRPGMTRAERRRAAERLAQTYEVTTRSLEIPVVQAVEGANRAQATARWHDGIAELVSFVESIIGRLCPTCQGRGYLEGGDDGD